MTSWADAYNQHVVYQSIDGHVHELYYSIGGTGPLWQTTDLTADTGAPRAAGGSSEITSWADVHNQHVVYQTIDGHVHELYYPMGGTGSLWKTTDLSTPTGAPPSLGTGALTSWVP